MVREPGQGGKPRETMWPYPLAHGEVAFVGEPIALVAAENRYIAEDAAALVEVDYEILAPVTDPRMSAQPGSPPVRRELSSNVVTTYRVAYGDADAAFRNAAHIYREEYFQHRGGAHSIEGRGAVAEYAAAMDGITLWASTQKAHDLHQNLCAFTGIDENRLRVAAPDIGGGFGPKLCVYPEDVALVAATKLLKRSLKWVEDRREHFISAVQERDQYWTVEIAVDADARILGIRGKLVHDQGAYALQDVNLPYNSASAITGPYMVPALAMDVVVAYTNKVPVSSVRGAGYPQAAFATERLMDRVAREMKLDRAELRARNLIPPRRCPTRAAEGAVGAPIFTTAATIPRRSRDACPRPVGRFPAPAEGGAQSRPLSRDRPRAWVEGHRARAVRNGAGARQRHRTGLGPDRGLGDGPGAVHRAGADMRSGMGLTRKRDGGRGRFLGRAGRPWRICQPANRDGGQFGDAGGARGRRRRRPSPAC
jgi:carbon-monoxide dehydrogenase large subunit